MNNRVYRIFAAGLELGQILLPLLGINPLCVDCGRRIGSDRARPQIGGFGIWKYLNCMSLRLTHDSVSKSRFPSLPRVARLLLEPT